MTEREKTCAERIDAHKKGREDDLGALFEAINNGAADYEGETISDEDAQERLDEFPLGVSTYRVLRVDLSTGGPADYIEAKLSRTGYGYEVESAVYHFADWFDHAETPLDEDSPLYLLAQQLAEIVNEDES